MPRRLQASTSPVTRQERQDPPVADIAAAREPQQLTAEQLASWADLVSRGEAEIPQGLSHAQEQELRLRVRQFLRQRLVQFIARQIARDIQRSAGANS